MKTGSGRILPRAIPGGDKRRRDLLGARCRRARMQDAVEYVAGFGWHTTLETYPEGQLKITGDAAGTVAKPVDQADGQPRLGEVLNRSQCTWIQIAREACHRSFSIRSRHPGDESVDLAVVWRCRRKITANGLIFEHRWFSLERVEDTDSVRIEFQFQLRGHALEQISE